MSSELAEMMFDVLNKRVGEEVVCTEWLYGAPLEHNGVLEEVVPFDKITVSKRVIPFVGEREAIEQIRLQRNDKTVYSNPKAAGYDRKGAEVALAQEEMLGYSINTSGAYSSMKEQSEMKIR